MDLKAPRAQLLPLRGQRLELLLALSALLCSLTHSASQRDLPPHSEAILARCRALDVTPTPPPSFHLRTQSDRFQPGTRAVLVKNATIWTGRVDGLEILKGIIVAVGAVKQALLDLYDHDTVDAQQGAWVTPGIVDMHSHLTVHPTPDLAGAQDGNSLRGLVLPWLRSVDSMNTHDDGFALAIAGGITTSLILPGSADAMGGQGFVLKPRRTKEGSSSALLLEPPFGLNGSDVDYNVPPRWRHMKFVHSALIPAVYAGTRMDTVWSVRKAYDEARKMKTVQDQYCDKALSGQWTGLGEFPTELALEALVDVLRGKVKVQTHCYEAVDIDAFIRMSNEFQFPVAAFHHAHEAYLVPEVLKRGHGHPPALALFGSFARYKREAYRHSDISDHPAIVSRYLIHEAQQAHYHGLSTNLALASVTSTPSEVLGLDHRIGFVKPGYDGDIVLWDSHPLALGVTPIQVFIDGIPQLADPHIRAPKTPDFDQEIENTIKYEGLPPLEAATQTSGPVLFRNISAFWTGDDSGTVRLAQDTNNVLVKGGVIVWSGSDAELTSTALDGAVTVDLEGGSISPALVSAGSMLGLQEIAMEITTADGVVFDPLSMKIPTILGEQTVIKAVDGLQFGTRDALLAYRAGVASAITPPGGNGMFQGLSASFSLGSRNKLEKGAIFQEIAGIHVAISMSLESSVSTQIATLRRLLLEPPKNEHAFQLQQGSLPLVITVHSADVIASLLLLKEEVENQLGKTMKMTLVGATEAHLLAPEISACRSFPYTWEQRRILAGPPLTAQSSAAWLASHNITVGLGPQGVGAGAPMSNWAVRNLRFDMAWVALESGGLISREAALSMASTNVEQLLGVRPGASSEFAVTRRGDLFSLDAKVIGMVSAKRGVVDLF
ncbi:hypothetical protein C8R46DRAFT_1158955 [Mycena filopes]|nr:hypothetical protein C8R46DRAFT_1158955 [Mycena filopes]